MSIVTHDEIMKDFINDMSTMKYKKAKEKLARRLNDYFYLKYSKCDEKYKTLYEDWKKTDIL